MDAPTPEDATTNRRKPRMTKRFVRILEWCIASAILGFITMVLGFSLIVQHYSASLPSTDQLNNYDPAVVTRLYSGDGKLMAEYAKEKRFFLPLSAIPKNVQQAFLSAEDKNFYSHQGVDIWGTFRAMKENLTHYGQGKTLVGGSTITQQVVKNFLLTSEKSFERKIKEAILAYRISNSYSKEKILELYLNEIYLGQGTYGVAAAAITYFDKSLDELTTEEAAFLAALPKAPAYFDPSKNYNRALERRNYVINRMREDGYIDAKEATRALATRITTRTRDRNEVARADFFAEEVRRDLASMYGSDVLYKGGLFVKTTLDPKFQAYADRSLRFALMMYDQRHGWRGPIGTLQNPESNWPAALTKMAQEKNIILFDSQQLAVVQRAGAKIEIGLINGDRGTIPSEQMSWAHSAKLAAGDVLLVEPVDGTKGDFKLLQIPAVNGAMVVMDPNTGRVLAMSGGYTSAGSEFNRATQAKRQPGSAFKPFVYLTALENGFSPTSVIVDGPISLSQGAGMPMWSPKNYEGDYLGPVTFRTALEHSRNAVTVRIASVIGIKRIKRVAKRMGIYDDDVNENYSMVLGAKETTLMKLVNAYSMIANGGRRIAPWLIERIDDRNGTTIFRRDTRICESCQATQAQPIASNAIPPTITDERERVIDPRVAYQITSILQGVITRGTASAAKVLNRPVAGKTGTTNESRDTWFIGYTPDIVIGTYVGFDTPKSLGEKETGGRVAIQGFIKFMQQAANDIPMHDFRPPPGIREIPIDRASGKVLAFGQSADGKSVIREAFLTGGPIFKPQNELDEETSDKASRPPELLKPEDIGTTPPDESSSFKPPAAGEMAPYQRPVDPSGFNPNGASTGTGGVY